MSPITDDERRQVRDLHAQGHGRNEISRRTGIHNRRVSAIAADLGLTFVRGARTAAATTARVADAAERRARLQVDMLSAAERLLGQMFSPAKVYNFGGKENDYNERDVDEPPFRDKRDIATALSVLVNGSVRLAEYDKGTGNEDERSMLGDLFDQLRAARNNARKDDT
ncbi:hypothetical protein J2S43_007870 [Catenuloplanes nepalensis]|uniref:Helix-turn-helix domain containing protein n=1 Tax=Catenuloplanes nepalensis TaxID=587533 RepID=A0ABT9N6N3_9ACTN|nr:helix-turn-helix domain-containing protein [Catenuloplanes nepalensis]MDP9799358.1 hypothetical protein [Catenuloplanes nepalensis]